MCKGSHPKSWCRWVILSQIWCQVGEVLDKVLQNTVNCCELLRLLQTLPTINEILSIYGARFCFLDTCFSCAAVSGGLHFIPWKKAARTTRSWILHLLFHQKPGWKSRSSAVPGCSRRFQDAWSFVKQLTSCKNGSNDLFPIHFPVEK